MLKAVLFDLDDTISDHRYSSRAGLRALQEAVPALQAMSLAALEVLHLRLLNEVHLRILGGELTFEQGRAERYRRLFDHCAIPLSQQHIERVYPRYAAAYQSHKRAVPGAVQLLEALHGKVKLAIITNHYSAEEQYEKLDEYHLRPLFDTITISAQAGCSKPDPKIFALTLEQLGVDPSEAVMIGDSWSSDIEGATGAGISAIWLNRFGDPYPDATKALQVNSLEPAKRLLSLLKL
jgi:putative hydrolase of the HAD superfamily